MKLLNTVILLSLVSISWAQFEFDWAVGVRGTGIEFKHIIADSQSGAIVMGTQDKLSSWAYEPTIVQGDGTEDELNNMLSNEEGTALISMDSVGRVRWKKKSNRYDTKVLAVTLDKADNVYVLAYAEPNDYDEDYGYDEEYDAAAEPETRRAFGVLSGFSHERHLAGYYILKLSPITGELVSKFRIEGLAEDISVSSFTVYGEDRFIIGGLHRKPGRLVAHIPTQTYSGGGDFVLMLKNDGTILWTDVVSHRLQYCCYGAYVKRQMDVAPDGTIYLAGSYKEGGIFGNGKHFLAPKSYGSEGYEALETFVVAYTPEGKIKWIQTAKSISQFQALKATNSGVYLSHAVSNNQSFGVPIDLPGKSGLVITHLNEKGKVQWNLVSNMKKITDFVVLENGNLLAVGTFKSRFRDDGAPGQIGGFTIKYPHHTFLATINPEGKVVGLQTEYLGSSDKPYCLDINAQGEVFMAFEIFAALRRDLSVMAKGLPKMECKGWTSVTGRVKL